MKKMFKTMWTSWIMKFIKTCMYPWVSFIFIYAQRTKEAFMILAIFLIIDFFLWIGKSYILSWGNSIKSKKMKSWLLAKMLILLIPMLFGVTGRAIWMDLSWLVNLAWWWLIVAELYSIIRNIYAIINWEEITEFDAITFVLRKLLNIVKNILEKLFN